MKASGKIGSNGVEVSDNVEKRFETDIHTNINMRYVNFPRGFRGLITVGIHGKFYRITA
jgi:hypothetical protein